MTPIPKPGKIEFNVPSLEIQNQVSSMLSEYFDNIKMRDKNGGLFSVTTVTPEGRPLTNAVLAYRSGEDVEIGLWIGKTWGDKLSLTYGFETKWYF